VEADNDGHLYGSGQGDGVSFVCLALRSLWLGSVFGGEARAVLVSWLTGVAVLKWTLFDATAVEVSLPCLFEWFKYRTMTYQEHHHHNLVVVVISGDR